MFTQLIWNVGLAVCIADLPHNHAGFILPYFKIEIKDDEFL